MPFEFQETRLSGVRIITPKVYGDERGFFFETYKLSEFTRCGISENFFQDNQSRSIKGTLRGLHYQLPPHAQAKLVRCIHGEIFDAIVDIRRSSPTFGQWEGCMLSAENKKLLYVPTGFAHGFYTVSNVAEILYKTTAEYAPDSERGIIWNDPEVGVDWPSRQPILSPKDRNNACLRDVEAFP
ncbi:MAG: dTDP-4-dehydrorhamnose 3,5-epimerase [Candidatus Cloacimonetes bacterium 4572_55]|nr:MAG: dTDP-4-dehydrorhamnose 3,5-epimerase [Candidatus Cloacimonetes bacterium 4572_55]